MDWEMKLNAKFAKWFNFNEVKHTSLLLVPELLEDPQID